MSNERIVELQIALRRTATLFQTGGSRPSPSVEQCWIGQVNLALPDEELPVDVDGEAMAPILQLYLPALPYVPDELKETELLTVFLSPNVLDHDDMSGYMCIREYSDTGKLVLKNFGPAFMSIKPFPLFPELRQDDSLQWDSDDIPEAYRQEILRLEELEGLNYFEDIAGEIYRVHKLGGYAAFTQPGIDFGDGYAFVLQIASDAKAGLNIVDDGNFYFAKHKKDGTWCGYFDFY
uniref:DUF1963 domain-containing protein n=1 Tax=Paenibacillus terrae TaxID=159743 RepID=UPI0011A1CC5B|nr:DUF1963 domain-containing protein [Paenibacillus terrae]